MVKLQMSEAQCVGRRPWTSSGSYDDINILLTLARAIEENENSKASCKSGIDAEEIIMKLINALIYTTVNNSNNGNGRGSHGGSGSMSGNSHSGGSGNNAKSDEGLIDLGLLNPNDHDNVLKLDLAKQKVVGVGLGNTN